MGITALEAFMGARNFISYLSSKKKARAKRIITMNIMDFLLNAEINNPMLNKAAPINFDKRTSSIDYPIIP